MAFFAIFAFVDQGGKRSEYTQYQTRKNQYESGHAGGGHFFVQQYYACQCADGQTDLTERLNQTYISHHRHRQQDHTVSQRTENPGKGRGNGAAEAFFELFALVFDKPRNDEHC